MCVVCEAQLLVIFCAAQPRAAAAAAVVVVFAGEFGRFSTAYVSTLMWDYSLRAALSEQQSLKQKLFNLDTLTNVVSFVPPKLERWIQTATVCWSVKTDHKSNIKFH